MNALAERPRSGSGLQTLDRAVSALTLLRDADRPLALRWQQDSWAAVTGPAARHQGYLTALACGSGCWAVGGKGGTRRNGVPYTSPLIEPLA